MSSSIRFQYAKHSTFFLLISSAIAHKQFIFVQFHSLFVVGSFEHLNALCVLFSFSPDVCFHYFYSFHRFIFIRSSVSDRFTLTLRVLIKSIVEVYPSGRRKEEREREIERK